MTDPIDLLTRLKDAPLRPLLESLRDVHRARQSDPDFLPVGVLLEAREPQRRTAPRATPSRRVARSAGPRPAAAPDAPARRDVREHFRRREAELRRDARLTERILDQMRSGRDVSAIAPPAPLQQELRLRAAPGEPAGGRFVVENETSEPLAVAFRTGRARGLSAAQRDRLRVRFEPAAFDLAPASDALVAVRVDVGELGLAPGDRIDVPVDVLGNGTLQQKLWVEVGVLRGLAESMP